MGCFTHIQNVQQLGMQKAGCHGFACYRSAAVLFRSRTAVAPLERLKILMQVQGSQKVYTGVWQVSEHAKGPQPHVFAYDPCITLCLWQGLVLMAKNEGLRGMFRGNWTNCVRIVPNSAVKFLTYEQLIRSVSASPASQPAACVSLPYL